MAFNFFCLVPNAAAVEVDLTVTTIVTPGGDDSSYQIPLTVPVIYDGVEYQNVYATTNSVITFGSPDGTYWAYPQTPSISIESKDWWALPHQMPDTHFIINVSQGGFQVDGAYRPYGSFSGEITSIIVTAQIRTDGTVAYTYAIQGPLAGDERTGARLVDGTVVTLEEAGVTQVEEAPVLEPEPIVNPTPEPESVVPLPVPEEPTPLPVVEPVYNPPTTQPEIPVVEPEPEILPLPEPTPEEEPVEIEVPSEVLPEPIEEQPVEPLEPPVVEEEATVTLENGVTLTKTQAIAVALLQDPGALLQEIFTNPGAALAALGQVGADMSPEAREKSEKVIIAAVIAGNIATAASVTASASASYRRKL